MQRSQNLIKLTALIFAALFLCVPASAVEVSSVTLKTCYAWVLQQSEKLKTRGETIQQSKARARAALGGAFPNVRWKWDETWQDPGGVEELERRGFAGFAEKKQIESRFTVEQPIFYGLREINAWSGFKRETARDELLYRREMLDLYEQVATIFYEIIRLQTQRENSMLALNVTENRVKELNSFVRLGKARDSEVFTSQAFVQSLKADIGRIDALILVGREDLSYLTGHDMSQAPLQDQIPTPPQFVSLEEALGRMKDRTDLQAQREDVMAQKYRVRYEQGYYWPGLDVTGNWYTQRTTTFVEPLDWDVMLSLDVPLYQGGSVAAHVKEAKSAYRESLLRLAEMERKIASSIRKTHGELTSAVKQMAYLEDATRAAKKSYDSLSKEYGLGLVTNLDVLQTLQFLLDQKDALDLATLRAKQLFIRLAVEMETSP